MSFAVTETTMPTAAQLGVGARFSVAVMDSDYVRILLDALDRAEPNGLEISTDEISTYVGGTETDVLRYVTQVIACAASSGAHVSAQLLLSRGCPGEVTCELSPTAALPMVQVSAIPRTGIRTAAHWSLYPLTDGARTRSEPSEPDHMRDIAAAVELARSTGTYAGSTHFATRLDGDLADVLSTVASGWLLVGRTVAHVTTHVTLSMNSPTTVAPDGAIR